MRYEKEMKIDKLSLIASLRTLKVLKDSDIKKVWQNEWNIWMCDWG